MRTKYAAAELDALIAENAKNWSYQILNFIKTAPNAADLKALWAQEVDDLLGAIKDHRPAAYAVLEREYTDRLKILTTLEGDHHA